MPFLINNPLGMFAGWQPEPLHISIAVFVCVLLLSAFVVLGVTSKQQLRRRLAGAPSASVDADDPRSIHYAKERKISQVAARAGQLVAPKSKSDLASLRKQLVRAGFLSPAALPVYYFVRVLMATALPVLFLLCYGFLPVEIPGFLIMIIAAGFSVGGLIIPSVALDWRRSFIRERYRQAFPDMMDLLVVCIESGQSLNAALERVGREIFETCPELGANMHIVSLEMRAGRTLPECLDGLHERLGIDEVKSLKLLLKQSQELGASIATTLRVYSDEMRDKRLMRAETKANALPVKLTLPLGMFIFPVILLLILVPIAIRIKGAMFF